MKIFGMSSISDSTARSFESNVHAVLILGLVNLALKIAASPQKYGKVFHLKTEMIVYLHECSVSNTGHTGSIAFGMSYARYRLSKI